MVKLKCSFKTFMNICWLPLNNIISYVIYVCMVIVPHEFVCMNCIFSFCILYKLMDLYKNYEFQVIDLFVYMQRRHSLKYMYIHDYQAFMRNRSVKFGPQTPIKIWGYPNVHTARDAVKTWALRERDTNQTQMFSHMTSCMHFLSHHPAVISNTLGRPTSRPIRATIFL